MKKRNENINQQANQLKERIKRQRDLEKKKEEAELNQQLQPEDESSAPQPDHLSEEELNQQLDPFSRHNCLIQLVYLVILLVALGFLLYFFLS